MPKQQVQLQAQHDVLQHPLANSSQVSLSGAQSPDSSSVERPDFSRPSSMAGQNPMETVSCVGGGDVFEVEK